MEKIWKLIEKLEQELKKIDATEDKRVELASLRPGEEFVTDIGKFVVLEQFEDGHSAVITKEVFKEDVKFDDNSTNYATSSLKELCDGEIYEVFADIFGPENIVAHEADLITVDGQRLYDGPLCTVRPLTFDEARRYNQNLINKELAGWYWTCTPWSSEKRGWKYSVVVVSPSGDFCNINRSRINGVRPFCILKSNIFVSKED